ncbi:MAG: hypothetical protein JXR68_02380 [Bacteroidales bacterium]|nr:hypothetical protein [Bacteroidales bacterium]
MADNVKNKRFKLANSYIISSISITFVLLILGFFSLFLFNTKDLSVNAKESVIVTIFLKPDAQQGEIDVLRNQIAAENYCKEIKLVSPGDALEDLKDELGEDIVDVLDHNPLPTTINLNLYADYSNTDSLQFIETDIKQSSIVDDVFYNRSMIYQLDKNVKKITVVVLVLEILLLLMATSLISNTVRLLIHSKRFEIKTMQLVGATSKFILKPFLITSFWHGLLSSLFAISALIIAILYYQSSVDDIIKIGHLEEVFGVVLLAGISLTVLSTIFSVRKYLISSSEDLFFN